MATMGTQELAYTPMYPVVNSQPTLGACFRNMGFGDYVRLVFGTGLGATVGFVGGKPVRRAGFWYLGGLSACLFLTASMRSSYHRLTGQRPNEEECRIAGIPYKPAPGAL